jgi:16S rRNA (cytosine1402-N4)-methyltransferase
LNEVPGEFGHKPVLLEEVIAALAIRPDGVYVDGTYGRGGHSAAILERLGTEGRLIAIDRDPAAVAAGRQWGQEAGDSRFTIEHARFSQLADVLRMHGVDAVDGVLLDLGVSSPQLDDPSRGFSFREDGPLDMRMDPTHGMSASEWLNNASEDDIVEVVRDYGEERAAVPIAKAIVARRRDSGGAAFQTTGELARLVAGVVRRRQKGAQVGKDPATRTFQAIRIHLNRELEELESVLPQCVDILKTGGRMAVISFHSLEDRMVKHFMRDMAQGDKLPKNVPIRAADVPKGKMRLVGKPVYASAEEVAANPRARSAVLRVAERS